MHVGISFASFLQEFLENLEKKRGLRNIAKNTRITTTHTKFLETMLSTTECSSSYLSSNDDSNKNEITNESCNVFSKDNKLSRFLKIMKFLDYYY